MRSEGIFKYVVVVACFLLLNSLTCAFGTITSKSVLVASGSSTKTVSSTTSSNKKTVSSVYTRSSVTKLSKLQSSTSSGAKLAAADAAYAKLVSGKKSSSSSTSKKTSSSSSSAKKASKVYTSTKLAAADKKLSSIKISKSAKLAGKISAVKGVGTKLSNSLKYDHGVSISTTYTDYHINSTRMIRGR